MSISHPELIMGDRIERFLEVHKAHIDWLLVLFSLKNEITIQNPFKYSLRRLHRKL